MWNSSRKRKLFRLSFSYSLRNHKQWMIYENVTPYSSTRGNFPSNILKTYMTVCHVLFSAWIINITCNVNSISRSYKILIASHYYFYKSIIWATSTALRTGNLLFLNHSWQLSNWLQDIKIFCIKLVVIFTVRWNQLCS